jgi:hypothetical protein
MEEGVGAFACIKGVAPTNDAVEREDLMRDEQRDQ